MEKYTLEYYMEMDRIKKQKAREYQSVRNAKIKIELNELREFKKNVLKKYPEFLTEY